MLRIAWRALIVVVALAVLALITAEIIFRTNLPRNIVIAAVQKQTGLHFEVNSLSTGFFGHTNLHGVAISLPLADKPFLKISEMSLDHSWLPTLLLGGDFTIYRADLDSPYLTLRQGADKTWNFQQIAQLLTPSNATTKPSQDVTLPTVEIRDATVVIDDGQNRSATIQHLTFDGQPKSILLWECKAHVPGHAVVTGKIATGRLWAHEFDFQFDDLKPWLSPWIASWPQDAKIQGQWSGRIEGGKLQGRLALSQAGYSSYSVAGPMQIATIADGALLQPIGATIHDANNPAFDTQFTSGEITINSTGIRAKNLGLQFPKGFATVDASFQYQDSIGNIQASWRDLAFPAKATHSGQLRLNFASVNRQPTFDTSVDSTGTFGDDTWDASITARATGDSRLNLDTDINVQKLFITGSQGRSVDFSGIVAEIGATSDGPRLQSLQLQSAEALAGQGGYSYSKKVAWFSLDGRTIRLPRHPPNTIDLDFNLWADPTRVHLSQLFVSSGAFSANLTGDYVYKLPKPVQARLTLSHTPQISDSDERPTDESQIPMASSLQSTLDISGTLGPADLEFTGTASGSDVRFRHRSYGDLNVQLSGHIRNDQVTLASQDIELLGGQWSINGTWPVRNSLFRINDLSVQHLSLPLATGDPRIQGSLDGKWAIDVSNLTLPSVTITGSATAQHVSIRDNPNLIADKIVIPHMRLANGWARSGPVTLKRYSGSAEVRVVTALDDPTRLWLNFSTKQWPVTLPYGAAPTGATHGASGMTIPATFPSSSPSTLPADQLVDGALLSCTGDLDLDLSARAALGNVDVSIDTLVNSTKLANLQSSIDVERRTLVFDEIKLTSHNTTATGNGKIDLDNPFGATADMAFNDFDLSTLAHDSRALEHLSGRVTGSVHAGPATMQRPLGPLEVDVNLNSDKVKFGNLALGRFQATAFLGPERFVLNDTPDRPTRIAIAGGYVHFWGRATRHVDDIYQTQLQATLQDLDLDTVIPAGTKTNRTPGLLNGQINIVMQPRHPELTFGQGALRISQSDLAGTGPIAFIYGILHVLHNPNKPTGVGAIDFNIQGRDAIVTSMRYFDRGAEVRISGLIHDLPSLPHSPLNLVALASARPLSNLNIPGLSDIDQALSAIQRNALTVEITGYLDSPKEKEVLFQDVTNDLKNMLFGSFVNEPSSQ
jgi:hypothetical protein